MAKLATLTERTASAALDTDRMYMTDAAGANDFFIERGALQQGTAEARTATSDGLSTGLITAGTRFVAVTSASATKVCVLPAGEVGDVIEGYVGTNGFALETLAAGSDTINTVDSSGAAQALIPTLHTFRVTKITSTGWILTVLTSLGAVGTAIVPA